MENKAPKLSVREKLGYGIGTASVNLIFNVVSTYLLFFYTNVYGLKPADAATMFLVVRIIDAVASPVYGTWVDKRTTKYGKYKGYLLYLSVPYAILSILCFVTPNTGYVFKLIYAYTTYVGLSLLNTFLSPMGAMPAAMTRDSNEIAQVNSYGTFCSNVGGMFISFGVPYMVTALSGAYTGPKSQKGWLITLGLFAIVGFIGLLFSFFSMHEHYQMSSQDMQYVSFKDIFTQIRDNKAFAIFLIYLIIAFMYMTVVNSTGSYYVTYNMNAPKMLKYFNLLGTLPSFILVPLFLAMTGKLLTSMGMIVVTGYMWAFEPEVVNYGEWKTGKRENAIISSVCSFAVALGMAIGGVIPGYVLKLIGFSASKSVQSAHTLHGILMLQSIIPIILIIIGIFIITKYPINDALMNRMNKEIDERKAK